MFASVHFIHIFVQHKDKEIMSLKGSNTKADYINWDTALNKSEALLANKKTETMGLYILVSICTGLRMSDVRSLTWEQLRLEQLTIKEQKTGKDRTIKFNDKLRKAISKVDTGKSGAIFLSQKGQIYTEQQINRKLKTIFSSLTKYHNISSHSLRKTFGRRVYEQNNQSERALMDLSDMFNHSNMKVTRIYLGIRQEELNDVYMNL
jgi:integrase